MVRDEAVGLLKWDNGLREILGIEFKVLMVVLRELPLRNASAIVMLL
jgi:hypothetical protein